jgi:outer membrane murein-binding lipoprotein Lpp
MRGARRILVVVIVFGSVALASCRDRAKMNGEAGVVTRGATAEPAEEVCLDAWLKARALDRYGSADGTVYAGGDPLFDETSDRATRLREYVYARHPDAARACAPLAKDGG